MIIGWLSDGVLLWNGLHTYVYSFWPSSCSLQPLSLLPPPSQSIPVKTHDLMAVALMNPLSNRYVNILPCRLGTPT